MRLTPPQQINRVLIRGTNWVGDAVITLPALREIRRIFPQAQISLLVKPWVAGIFEDLECVDELIAYQHTNVGLWGTIRQLRPRQFEVAILLQNAFEAALLAWGAGASQRWGFNTQWRSWLLRQALKLTPDILAKHQIYYYLHLVAQMETRLVGHTTVDFQNLDYRLPVSLARRQAIEKKTAEWGVDWQRPVVAINPGATNSRAKRWPTARFGALADLLHNAGVNVVFIGAAAELDITQIAVAASRSSPIILTGKTSLAESIAFLSNCSLLISNDTGPAYLAAALDRPTLTIFGPTNDQMICPFGSQTVILRHPVDCAPCMLRDCPIDHRCMTQISVDTVFQRALTMLGQV
jgi:heptosyltransferase II